MSSSSPAPQTLVDEQVNASENKENAKLGLKNRIPKSLSAPLRLIKYTRNKPKILANVNNNEALDEALEHNIYITDLPTSTSGEKVGKVVKKAGKPSEKYENLEQTGTFSIRGKLSRFVIDVGTYVVTCGGSNSRKLAGLRGKNEFGTRITSRFSNDNRSFRRKKSLLLTSSELSLNTLDNNSIQLNQ